MHLSDARIGLLTAFSAIGIGAGSLAAGRLSGDKVELGLAPIGAIGMGVFAIALARSGHSFTLGGNRPHPGRLLRRSVRGAR